MGLRTVSYDRKIKSILAEVKVAYEGDQARRLAKVQLSARPDDSKSRADDQDDLVSIPQQQRIPNRAIPSLR
ncbi:kinesin-II 85 kDa subunit [Pseudozyma hubeiensis SY62]|uniref:Kinesin-II 85 kDa subunit n=1 Tax=Pseudozyma hubeiensis (strain SY62) TaxID=1305764 RepID=R9P9G7_PSEHS|nr:kinesin-II 85 kDa subunit [Pseudozyma hubeiensis SY62]GAC97872.1 kinesin-II 85 kDa subunit [Pseudozyma hubeiensis SY62]